MCVLQRCARLPPHPVCLASCTCSHITALALQDPDDGFSAAQILQREALALVIPFRSNNFMTRHEDHRPPGQLSAAMRFADACASQLMGEIQVEGIGVGLTIQIQGRVKSLYSTHRKMQLKGVPIEQVRSQCPLECRQKCWAAVGLQHACLCGCTMHATRVLCGVQVYDSVALRVVVSDADWPGAPDPIMTCYRIPPVAYRLWQRVQTEYDDYITRPKGSGYKSIHLAVIGPSGVPLEVQARTPPPPSLDHRGMQSKICRFSQDRVPQSHPNNLDFSCHTAVRAQRCRLLNAVSSSSVQCGIALAAGNRLLCSRARLSCGSASGATADSCACVSGYATA